MKKNLKFKRILKKIICYVFAIVTFFTYGIHDQYVIAETIQINEDEQGYKWTRVESQADVEAAISAANDNYPFDKMDRDYTKDTYWTRVMIIWSYYRANYFACQGAGATTDVWCGKQALTSYGINVESDTFYTRSGLDTPWFKMCTGGQQEEYEGDYAYCFRLCETGKEKMTDYCAAVELNFFGIAYHAATDSSFCLYAKVNDKWNGDYKSKWSTNDDRLLTVNMEFTPSWHDCFDDLDLDITKEQANTLLWIYQKFLSDKDKETQIKLYEGDPETTAKFTAEIKELDSIEGYDSSVWTKTYTTKSYPNGVSGFEAYLNIFSEPTRAYYNQVEAGVSGKAVFFYDFDGDISRRYWCVDSDVDGGNLSTRKSLENGDCHFYIYVGTPYNTAHYSSSTLPKGITYFGDDVEINEGSWLTVGPGSTLIIKGHVYNNGYIHVNGGTLIVSGVLDTDDDVLSDTEYVRRQCSNKLIVNNGGSCIVTESGLITSRGPYGYIWLQNGSSMQIDGTVVTNKLKINSSTVRAGRNSFVFLGCELYQYMFYDLKWYIPANIRTWVTANPNTEIEDYVWESVDPDSDNNLDIEAGSFISDGIVFIPGDWYVQSDSWADARNKTRSAYSFWKETDEDRTLKAILDDFNAALK